MRKRRAVWVSGIVQLAYWEGRKVMRPMKAAILSGVLAVHRRHTRHPKTNKLEPASGWRISHVPTGYSLPYCDRGTQRDAKATAELLLNLADWQHMTDRGPKPEELKRLRAALKVA